MLCGLEHEYDARMPTIQEAISSQVDLPPWCAETSLLCSATREHQVRRQMIYAGIPGGSARRQVTGGKLRRLSYRGPFDDYVNHRALPGRDPEYQGDTEDVLLYPCDWVSALQFCDGFNLGNVRINPQNFAYLTVILCSFVTGMKHTLSLAEKVLAHPHRAEVILLVEPDILQMLESSLPTTGFRR